MISTSILPIFSLLMFKLVPKVLFPFFLKYLRTSAVYTYLFSCRYHNHPSSGPHLLSSVYCSCLPHCILSIPCEDGSQINLFKAIFLTLLCANQSVVVPHCLMILNVYYSLTKMALLPIQSPL